MCKTDGHRHAPASGPRRPRRLVHRHLAGGARAPLRLHALLLITLAVTATPGQSADLHLGVATCASTTCHGTAKPADGGNIQRNEYVIWSRFDPHAGAYRTLLDERSVAIARRLGLAPAHESRICLDCHADNVPSSARGPRFQLDDGIGCEACHGGAARWLASHDDFPAVGHADNVAAGMIDLADPGARAAVCTGCHVGDGGDGATDRFASHRLMAAGHPRLSFELDTFTELWRTSGGREHYRRDADYAGRKPTAPATAVWTTGLVASARAQLQVISGRHAAGGALPDFALFNCYSCHRAMRLEDWRDKGRDSGSDPGNLRFDDGVLTVLEAALAARPALQARLAREVALWQRTAGAGHDALRRQAAKLDALLGEIGRDLAARPLAPGESRQALAALVRGAGRGAFPDYVGAEHAAMGLAVLVEGTGERERYREPIDALFRALENDERYDAARFSRLLAELQRR